MNEEKLNQILNQIGKTEVPLDIALVAEKSWQNFSQILKIQQPKQILFTPIRLIAAAAVILIAFSLGRWSNSGTSPQQTISPKIAASMISNNNRGDFWHQKIIAATQSRPYAQTQFDQIRRLNSYKQYLKEKHND